MSAIAPYSLNSIPFLLSNSDSLGARGQGDIVVRILTQKLKKLVRVRGYQLSQLRVSSTELLEDGLKHLRLLLHYLAKLLKLSIMSEEIQVTQVATLTGSRRSRRRSRGSIVTPSLGCKIKQVHISFVAATLSRLSGRACDSLCWLALLLLLLLLLLNVLGDALVIKVSN